SILMVVSPALAQQAQDPDPMAPVAAQKLTKEQKKKMGKALKELDAQYKQWLNEDVVYIISPAERTAFLQYSTNEEREQFIEQFWRRRSAKPDVRKNDIKEDHYPRIVYANKLFAPGTPGGKSERGGTYIFGVPADEVDSHPTGGTYDRPMEEGGGSTTTYP